MNELFLPLCLYVEAYTTVCKSEYSKYLCNKCRPLHTEVNVFKSFYVFSYPTLLLITFYKSA